MTNEKEIQLFSEKSSRIFSEIKKDIIGQSEVVEGVVIAMIAGGNVLLEGVPGVGKTRLVRSVGRVFSLPFSRIQFTPDLMPADITGTNVIERDASGNSVLRFRRGPIFSNIILADEINRATSKTQSALLEAMQEHTVTAGGDTYRLDEPFFVLATQNPIEQDGTYPLPEAQTDRFMFKLIMGYPSDDELESIVAMTQKNAKETSAPVLNGGELLTMRKVASEIPVCSEVMKYAIRLVGATHPEREDAPSVTRSYIRFGASPRAAQALITAAKVRALLYGRFNVSTGDIDALALPVLRHRIKPSFNAVTERLDCDRLIGMLISELKGEKPKQEGTPDKRKKSKKI